MYSRSINSGLEKIIQNGKPVFGTFDSIPDRLDIKGVAAPFGGIPLPASITRLMIRAHAIYNFSAGDFIGTVDLFDNKIMNMVEVCLWNKKTGQKYAYRTFLGARKRLVPTNLTKGTCVSTPHNRHVRLSWNHPDDRLSFSVMLRGDEHRPDIEISFSGRFSHENATEIISVKPAPTMRRCSASWYASMPVNGSIKLDDKKENEVFSGNGTSLLFINRAYYKFRTRGESITATGLIDGKTVTFRLSTSTLDAVDTENYNDNLLFTDSCTTALPPVCITHPFGTANPWIIQDFESMVDLEFTPVNVHSRSLNLIAVNFSYETVFGKLNGVLLDKNGNKIVLKDFHAVARRSMLRL